MGLEGGLLDYLDRAAILAAYDKAAGDELRSGKFESVESSAALAANLFGYFINRPRDFPHLDGICDAGEITSVSLERCLRFPWQGGTHPWLDAVLETDSSLIAVESKRYEPFRARKRGLFSDAYRRPVWGGSMQRFESMRDRLSAPDNSVERLDGVQLVKHALGLVTQARISAKRPILVYLYAEPDRWPDGRPVPLAHRQRHAEETRWFAEAVAGGEVVFRSLTWEALLSALANSDHDDIRSHGAAVAKGFAPLWPHHTAV